MDRERRHVLHEIVRELHGSESEIRQEQSNEPDEEARQELAIALSSLIDAVEHIHTATEVDDSSHATARTTRPRRQRDAPEKETEGN